jgi:hypothetical protein
VSFYVDDIKPMHWNDEAYDHLVYPEEQKDLVLSFVDNHKRTKQGVDDVIMGKGQGLILLLSGPPGTGKTLTAEAGNFLAFSTLTSLHTRWSTNNTKQSPTKPAVPSTISKQKTSE